MRITNKNLKKRVIVNSDMYVNLISKAFLVEHTTRLFVKARDSLRPCGLYICEEIFIIHTGLQLTQDSLIAIYYNPSNAIKMNRHIAECRRVDDDVVINVSECSNERWRFDDSADFKERGGNVEW